MRYLPYKFTAKEQDEETGLYYYGARYLDAKYSRWLSADPAVGEYVSGTEKGQGGIYNQVNFNLYHYAGNNPLKYTDPNGKFAINIAAAIGGTIIGGVLGAATAYAAGCDKNQILAAAAGGAAAGALAGITLGASVAVQSAVVSATISGATSAVVDGAIQVVNAANGKSDAKTLNTRSMAAAGVSGFISSIIIGGLSKMPSVATGPEGKVLANIVGSNVGGEVSTLLKNSRNGDPLIQKDQQIANFVYSTVGGVATSALDNPTVNSLGKGIVQGFKKNMATAATQEYLKEKMKIE